MSALMCGILRKSLVSGVSVARSISVTSASRLKQIEVIHDENKGEVVIKGKYIDSQNRPMLVPEISECQKEGKRFCPECTLGLDIKHTDVLILSQYVRDDGCMMPQRVTGLCNRQQKRMSKMVTMAQKAGLMMNLTPHWSKKDPKRRFADKKFNKYFFEETIKTYC